MFKIRMGIPGMKRFWDNLVEKKKSDNLDSEEEGLFKKLAKTIKFLSTDPKYPSLQSHEIEELSKKYSIKIWQSYLDQARRIFWAYGPNRKEITILGIEPHPEDKKRGAYKRIKLSKMPK